MFFELGTEQSALSHSNSDRATAFYRPSEEERLREDLPLALIDTSIPLVMRKSETEISRDLDYLIKEVSNAEKKYHFRFNSHSLSIINHHVDLRSTGFVKEVIVEMRRLANIRFDELEVLQEITLSADQLDCGSSAPPSRLELVSLNMPLRFLRSEVLWIERKLFYDSPGAFQITHKIDTCTSASSFQAASSDDSHTSDLLVGANGEKRSFNIPVIMSLKPKESDFQIAFLKVHQDRIEV